MYIAEITQSFESEISTPFLRAYSPTLSTLFPPLSPTSFLQFLDSLNEVFIANPILQATGIAGEVMGYIPTLEIPGMAIETVSEVGSEVGSWLRTRAFLKRANEGVFRERGVRVKIVGAKDLGRLFGIGVEGLRGLIEATDQGLGGTDRMGGDVGLLERLSSQTHCNFPYAEDAGNQDRLRRSPGFLLLDALWDRVAPLETVNLPEVFGDTNRLKRWNAMYATREGQKQHEKIDKKHREAKQKQRKMYQEAISAGEERDKEIAKIEQKIEDVENGTGRSEQEVEKKLASLNNELEKARKRKEEKMKEKIKSGDGSLKELRRKDVKKALKMKYLVILPLDERDRDQD